jgi:hypothetical protein
MVDLLQQVELQTLLQDTLHRSCLEAMLLTATMVEVVLVLVALALQQQVLAYLVKVVTVDLD